MPATPPTHSVEQEAAAMSEDHARSSAAREAANVRDKAEQMLRDLADGRVPTSSDMRSLGTAATDLARGVGLLSAYAEARRLLNDDRVR